MKLASFAKNNHWITLGVICLIIGIIIIPEFFSKKHEIPEATLNKNQQDSYQQNSQFSNNPQNSNINSSSNPNTDSVTSNRVITQISGSYGDFLSRFQSGFSGGGGTAAERPSQKIIDYYKFYSKNQQSYKIDVINLDPSQVTWQYLKSNPVRNTIRYNTNSLRKILPELSKRFPNLGQRIENFIELTQDFYMREAEGINPLEVVSTLESQEAAITQEMLRLSISRLRYIDWAKISYSRVYGNTAMLEYKLENIPKYNPNLLLTKVSIKIPGSNLKSGTLKLENYKVSALGMFWGDDTKSVELIRRGFNSSRVTSQKSIENPLLFNIQLNNLPAAGIYIFKFTDIFGAIYERTYSFDPRFRAITWNDKEQNNITANLPSQAGVGTVYLKDRIDLSGKVDAYFRYGNSDDSDLSGFGQPSNNGGFMGPNDINSSGNTF